LKQWWHTTPSLARKKVIEMDVKFKKNVIIRGKITLKTGMHIGGLKDSIKIGGIDSPVITIETMQDNFTKNEVPYIPGSSLKGKMRRLITNIYGSEYKNGLIDKVFGTSKEKEKNDMNVTRAVFRDAYMEGNFSLDDVTEIKGENMIDPVTSKANPRFIQRVIPGVKFNYEIILTIFEGDSENDMLDLIKEGFKLIADSYIGGNGTRGYGRIDYTFEIAAERDINYYENLAKSD